MSEYKIHKPEGAPDWFVPGIECEVSHDGKEWYRLILSWYKDGEKSPFISTGGLLCPYARPVEQWEPVEGEDVLGFDDDGIIGVGKYGETVNAPHPYYIESGSSASRYQHIARLKYPDGRTIDVTGGIEAIKKRTDWI